MFWSSFDSHKRTLTGVLIFYFSGAEVTVGTGTFHSGRGAMIVADAATRSPDAPIIRCAKAHPSYFTRET